MIDTLKEIKSVLQVRHSQHLLNEMLKQKRFAIPIHLAFGHEAIAVGLDFMMGSSDSLCLSHRNAAYNIARLKHFDQITSYYDLSSIHLNGIQMGSMNLAAFNTGICYSSSILGNNLAVATGIAMNRKLMCRPGISIVVTGDGAIEEGVLWESLIFARSHHLPLLVVLENNNYSMSSTIPERRSQIDFSKICEGVDINYDRIDGSVLSHVISGFSLHWSSISAGRPTLLEFDVSTFNQHCGPTPGWPTDPLNISLDNGLTMGDDPTDPLNQIKKVIGDKLFEEISNQVAEEIHS